MRHMRSRRILAMLLALSMIFGLLTTTAFAGEVDQNTSNVGESAANGTSEGGSGEGQSSGASEDESSKVTNKEDVPTEEETIPEEKKTTSDEEVDTQVGEEPTPVETQLTNYVMVGGIAGFADTKFASFEAAYEAIQPEISKLAASDELGQGGATSAAAFKEFFTDVDNSGNATLTYTITGNVPYDETNHSHLLTMGRSSSHYNADSEQLHLINFKFVGANGDRADTLTVNSDITLPYEWWGENTTTSISFEDLTITGSAPNGLYPYQSYFEGIDFTVNNCTLKGIKIYNCANVGGSYTITNSTLDGTGTATDAYAIHLQGHETAPLNITIRDNEISGYDRGINIDQKTAVATISNNKISVNDNGRSCIQLSGLAETTISGNTLALNGGNAFTLHEKLLTLSAAPEISITGNTISGNGYLIYDDAAANGTAFTADTLKLTYGPNTVDDTVDTTKGVKDSTVVEAGSAVQDAIKGTTSNAVTTSEELADAIANAADGDTIKLAAGEFTTYSNTSPKKSLTFVGSGEGTVWTIGDLGNTPGGEKNGDYSFDGCATITFKNMTLKSDGADYRGFIRISNTIVDDCVLSGKTAYWGYETAKFINSKFNAPEGDYALWDYSSKSMSFDGCEFNISGKGVNVYVEAGNAGTDARKVEVKDCTVTSTKENKAFLNIKNSTQAYDVTISGNNTVNGLAANGTTGSNLYQVEATEITEASGKPLTVKQVDAEGKATIVYQVKNQTGVATVDGVSYDTLKDAFAALSDKAYTLTLNDESAWDATTPVYWAAGEQSGYAATLAEALTKAYMQSAESIKIVCRPNADVGEMTHGHVADNLTIYGNKAYISAGECDLEVDTYKYDRSTGKQVKEDGEYLTKDITITAYELDNLGVWGERHTEFTVNVNLTDCDGKEIDGKTNVQRVYISGETGVNNITLTGCDFETKATSVYSNADGEINITDCSFTGAQVPVNFNHKANGEQTLRVSNCEFNACGDKGEWAKFAAPVRFVNSGSGKQSATVDTCKFTDTVGSNGDILIGDGRTGQDSNDVSLTVTNTEANIQAQQPGYYNGNETDTSKLGTATSPASGTLTTSVEKLISGGSTATTNVAKVGETEYATLEAAVAAVTDTDNTITLLTDVIQNTQLALNRSLTLNLDGHTIKNENDIWGEKTYCLLRVEDNAVVTITGNGTVAAKKDDCYAISITSGSLTIENGTFIGNISAVQVETGSLTIKDGTFKQIQESKYGNTYVINCIDDEFASGAAAVAIYGGTFVGFDPNVSPEQKVDGVTPSFAAPGVGITKNADGTFTAVKDMTAQLLDADGNSVKAYTSLADAITAASEGQIIRLLADAKEDVTIDKNITLDLGGKTLTNNGAGKATITIAEGATATVKNGSVVGGTSYYNIQNNGTATFEGLTATAGNTGSSMIDNVGTLTITSGEYTGGLDTIKNEPNAKLTVDGGTFTLTKGTSDGFTGVIFNYGELTINDGTFIQNDKSAPYGQAQVIHTDKSGSNLPSTVIKGGTFKNLCTRSTAWTVRATNAAAGATKVSGGSFNTKVQETYCADGFIPTKNADGTYGVKEGKYVASVGSKNYETLADAIRLTTKGKIVKLLDDVTENIEIAKAKNFTLDLNGHTINGGTVKDKATITNYGTVTIIDSSAAKTGTIKRDDNGTVGETSYYVIRNIGTMTIEQANVTNNSGYKKTNPSGSMVGSSLICNGDDDLGGTLNISGGNFEQKNFIAIKNGALGKLNVTGGTISSDHSAIQNWFEATITGGEINGQLWTDAYIKDESVGHTTIGGNAKYTGEIVMDISGSVKPTLEISGGDLNVTNWRITTAASKAGAKPAVSGGKFTSAVPESYCADGYVPTKNEDGTYGVKVDDSVAEVGGVKYLSLQAAIDAAGRKQTVKLLKDTTENVTMATSDLTLDLNGHTLNGGQVKGKPALTVTARVTVKDSSANMSGTIKREDTAENSGVSSHYVIDVQGNGWLTFESGNVTNNSGVVGVKGASLVRVGDDSVEKYPGLNIKGGTFQQDNFIAIKVDRGDLFLNGGTITSENSYAIENWFRTTIKGGTVNGTVSTWVYSNGKAVSQLGISGGTVNGNVASVTYDNSEGKTAKVTISGGTVTGTLGTYSYNDGLVPLDDPAKATIGVTGGTFDIDPTPYVVEGSTVKKDETTGKYGVEKAYLAKVGETSYYTMDEAFHAAVASGETLYLLRDYTTNSEQNSGSNSFTIDLNGFTWTYTGTDTNYAAFEINYPNVTLTVKNGTVVSNSMVGLIPSAMGGTITYDNSGLVFESVQATANGHSGIETNGNNTNDTVTLKNSTLNVPNGFGIYFPSSGTLTIDNSVINAKTMGVQVCSGSLDIKGAETKIEVTGDGVEKTENDGAIQDGAAISIVNRAGYKGLGTITVTEGTFKAKSGNDAVKAYDWSNKEPGEANFTASDKVAISGGTYSTPVAANLCAEGFVPKDNGNGTYGVQPDGNVAEIGSVKYASLDEALKAAKDRETVKLLKDVEATQVLVTKGTLDLNGKTLKVSYFMSFSDVIDSTEGNGLIETGVQSFFTTNNSYLPLRDSAANGYRLFSYQLNKLGIVKGSPTAFWFNIVFGGEKAYSLLNTAGHNADLFIPMQIGSGNEWQYIKMNQSTLRKWTTPILNGTAPSKCGYYVNITGLDTLTSGTVLTLKTSIRSCGVEKLSDDSLTYTVK